MQKLLLVDGSNLLFQMFFGMPARIVNAQGKAIQGTMGFVGALLKILRRVQPTHAVVLFDGEHENGRKDVDPAYKANRLDFGEVPEEENPYTQLQDVCAALDYLGIARAVTVDCETDDWIAAYVRRYRRECEIVISSFDSDFFQLIDERVSVLRYRGEKTVICTPEYIRQKFGIAPEQYAGMKALTGDKVDNIGGVAGIGVKTAAALIHEYGDLQTMLENAQRIKRKSVREAVAANAERILMNYRLIRLEGNVPLPFELDALEYADMGEKTGDVLRAIGLK